MRAHTHIGIHLAWSWRSWHWHTEIYSGVCTDVVGWEVFTCTVLWKMSTWETSDIFITFKICREIYFSQRYFVILRRQEVATKKLLLFILFVGLVLLGPWGLLNLILNKYKTQEGIFLPSLGGHHQQYRKSHLFDIFLGKITRRRHRINPVSCVKHRVEKFWAHSLLTP